MMLKCTRELKEPFSVLQRFRKHPARLKHARLSGHSSSRPDFNILFQASALVFESMGSPVGSIKCFFRFQKLGLYQMFPINYWAKILFGKVLILFWIFSNRLSLCGWNGFFLILDFLKIFFAFQGSLIIFEFLENLGFWTFTRIFPIFSALNRFFGG